MRLLCLFCAALAWVAFWSQDACASSPGNDLCATAAEIPAAGPFPYLTLPVDIRDATTAGDPPLPACASGVPSRSVWYRFTPSVAGEYTISTCTDTSTTVPDTLLAVYTASGNCTGFAPLACAEDVCGIRGAIAANLAAATTYYIVGWDSIGSVDTNAVVQLRVSLPAASSNDTCAGGSVVPSAGPFPYTTAEADTRLAGVTGDPPPPACGAALERSVWFAFTPATTAIYNLSIGSDSGSTIYYSVLAIYSAPGCAGPFTMVACAEAEGFATGITTNLLAGTTYYVVAWDPEHTTGESLLRLRVNTAVPRITSAARLSSGHFQLRFDGNLTQSYTVQASTDLLNWAFQGSVTRTNVFTDRIAPAFTHRFYRLRTP